MALGTYALAWIAKDRMDQLSGVLVLILGVSIIGAVADVTGGMSREGVVGDIVPAALGLLGGVAVYLFGGKRGEGRIASVSAAAFALSLGFGYASAATQRVNSDRYLTSLEFCSGAMRDADLLRDSQAYCRFATNFGAQCGWVMASELSWSRPAAVHGESYTRDDALQDH